MIPTETRVEDASRNDPSSPFWKVVLRRFATIKLGGTVFFTLVATMVVLVSERTRVDLGVSNQLLTVLGLVLGFVISFRTSSAYERYQEGRKMWTNIIVASRSLAHQIWIHVLVDQPRGRLNNNMERSASATIRPSPTDILEEKMMMIKLVQAVSVSVKHLLRGEESVYYKDLYPLIHFLPQYVTVDGTLRKLPLWHIHEKPWTPAPTTPKPKAQGHIPYLPEAEPRAGINIDATSTSSSVKSVRIRKEEFVPQSPTRVGTYVSEHMDLDIQSEYELKPARSPPDLTVYDYLPALKYLRFVWRVLTRSSHPPDNNAKTRRRKVYTEIVTVHVPIEICLVLSNYGNFLMRNNLVDPVVSSHIADNLFLLQDTVSNLERICNTPLPFAYQAHLKMCLWIYLVLLPFQIYSTYNFVTIPATAFAAFLMLGFLDIAEEIENPFDYDFNDLDLDHFCSIVKRDIHEITSYTNLDSNDSELLFGGLWNRSLVHDQV